MSVCTQAGVGAVWVHCVSGPAGADEACAIKVRALMLAQILVTVAIEAKIWRTDNMQKTAFEPHARATYRLSLHRQINSDITQ